jgi:hypothetical protein
MDTAVMAVRFAGRGARRGLGSVGCRGWGGGGVGTRVGGDVDVEFVRNGVSEFEGSEPVVDTVVG